MFQICGAVEAVGFPVQNIYNMAYCDELTTFEPVNGYKKINPLKKKTLHGSQARQFLDLKKISNLEPRLPPVGQG